MRATFKILFYVNKSKEKDGIVPIMGRVTINGTQSHLTSSLRTPKILVKEFCYFLMPIHQHGLCIDILVQR